MQYGAQAVYSWIPRLEIRRQDEVLRDRLFIRGEWGGGGGAAGGNGGRVIKFYVAQK